MQVVPAAGRELGRRSGPARGVQESGRARIQLLSRSGHAPPRGARAGEERDHRLARRHVRHGGQPPRQGLRRVPRRRRSDAALRHGHPRHLQGAHAAGRGHRPVRGHPAQPDRPRRHGELPQHRPVEQEGHQRGQEVRHHRGRARRRGCVQLHHHPRGRLLRGESRGEVPALHAQRDHRRCGVRLRPRRRRGPGRGGHELDNPVAADRRRQVRSHLRRRPEERRPCRVDLRHRA